MAMGGTAGMSQLQAYANGSVRSGYDMGYTVSSQHSMEWEMFVRDGIDPEHGQQLNSLRQNRQFGYGYTAVIPDIRTLQEYTYQYVPGHTISGWKLVDIYDRNKYLGQLMGVVTSAGTSPVGAVSKAKPKEPDKNSKTIRHQFLRNRLKNREVKI